MASGSEIAAAAARNATLAIENAARHPTNSLDPDEVQNAAPQIEAAVERAIATTPEMQHVLNTEPFWRKRSFWATVAAGCAGLAAVADYLMKQDGEINLVTAGFALWAGYSAFRAGVARAPLGIKPTETRHY